MTDLVKVAMIAATPPTLMTGVTYLQGRKIHTLVNSKMTAALKEIHDLKALLTPAQISKHEEDYPKDGG